MTDFFLGIDMGGTNIKIGIVHNHQLIDNDVFEVNSNLGLAPVLQTLEKRIPLLLEKHHITVKSLSGIGIAFPGIVNPDTKQVLSTNEKYFDAPGLNLEKWAYHTWQLPLCIDNDARIAAIGEWKYGNAEATDNLVVVTLGTGIGSSAIINGKVLQGTHFQAGILGGHFSINYKGGKCNCGNVGCAESEMASWNLKNRIENDPLFLASGFSILGQFDFKTVFQLAEANDSLALKIKDQAIRVWSAAIINLIHAYDPDTVILSGGVLNSRNVIIPAIEHNVHQNAWCNWGKVKIVASTLGDHAALLGSCYRLQHTISSI